MIRILKLKPLSSSIESLSHQLLQRCSVSGTAKGKGKLKGAQPLKRSKVTTKKGAVDAVPKSGGKGSERDRLEKFYDQCLNAPTPVRYLTPKQREREAEREKLGLISKDRQREIEMMKKDKGKMGISEKPTIIGTPGLDLISLGLVDENEIPKYELTVEDGRRLAKEYSRVLMRRHRARQSAESNLLRMKKEAIEALPEHLKAAAMVPDLTPFPVNRFMATLTPPIEGYIDKVKEAATRSIGKEKLR
ncbi:copper ion binding protein [Trema orientale]|uniref:Copper ion binding protein n=1 Tax=Trema orientale TaxID=63057 RepID=A0A2P5ENJ7_TREOI|nr:copper ion binding protein [Trema orientale]